MAEYVENYQTLIDTQSGQHWQKMQESIANTFSGLQAANVAAIKANSEAATKQAKLIQDRRIKSQADTLDYTTNLQSDFSKMDPIDFHKTFDKVIETRAKYRAKMESGKTLTAEESLEYTNALNAPNIVKNALANQLNVLQTSKEAMSKEYGIPGSYSILNNGSDADKYVLANTPVKGGKNIRQTYTLGDDFRSVGVGVNVGEVNEVTLSGSNLEASASAYGGGGIYTVVDQAGYIDKAKDTSKIYISKDELKSGDAPGLLGSVKKEFLDTKNPEKKMEKDGSYHYVYNLSAAGTKAIENGVDQIISTYSTADLLSYGADKLFLSQEGVQTGLHPKNEAGKEKEVKWIDPTWLGLEGNKDKLVARIRKDMLEKIPKQQPEMDEVGSGVKMYPGPKKPPISNQGKTKAEILKAIETEVQKIAIASEKAGTKWDGAKIRDEIQKRKTKAGL